MSTKKPKRGPVVKTDWVVAREIGCPLARYGNKKDAKCSLKDYNDPTPDIYERKWRKIQ